MSSSTPREIGHVGAFLESAGLALLEKSASGGMGNQLVRYGDNRIQVRLVCDHRQWFIEVHDPLDAPEAWTGMSLFRSILTGAEDDPDLPLSVQAETLQTNWTEILDRLRPEKAAQTHAQLDAVYRQRLKRMLPRGLPDGWQ